MARLRGQQSRRGLEKQGLRIGRNVLIARGAVIDPGFLWLVEIGDDTTIAPGVQIIAHDASTKHLLGSSLVERVAIGRRVYLGTNAVVLPGVTIGDDAVVGAASVVRHDVPADSVAVGMPAKIVGTTKDFSARHREQMQTRPVWGEEWTLRGGITAERKLAMYEALADGPGYVA
jgi:maltose O-acetyltransferase